MLKLTKNHTIFEIWNDWTGESVYIDHKPSQEELEFIVKKIWKPRGMGLSLKEFVKYHLFVQKERRMYTMTEEAKRDKYHRERGEE